jgi:hypothetical protein
MIIENHENQQTDHNSLGKADLKQAQCNFTNATRFCSIGNATAFFDIEIG